LVKRCFILFFSKCLFKGVEPTGASAMYQSVQKGQPVSLQKIETFVNGLAPPYAGKNAYEIVKRYVDEIVLVEDDQVKDAMKLLYNDQKVVVEPAGNF
jgi:threonine dehydratase